MLLRGLFRWGVGTLAIVLSPLCLAVEIMDNGANATILANQAKSLVEQNGNAVNGSDNNQKARNNRGSAISENLREAECGGVAIGNVRPAVGDHRQHNTTIIIKGNVINSNNKC